MLRNVLLASAFFTHSLCIIGEGQNTNLILCGNINSLQAVAYADEHPGHSSWDAVCDIHAWPAEALYWSYTYDQSLSKTREKFTKFDCHACFGNTRPNWMTFARSRLIACTDFLQLQHLGIISWSPSLETNFAVVYSEIRSDLSLRCVNMCAWLS